MMSKMSRKENLRYTEDKIQIKEETLLLLKYFQTIWYSENYYSGDIER